MALVVPSQSIQEFSVTLLKKVKINPTVGIAMSASPRRATGDRSGDSKRHPRKVADAVTQAVKIWLKKTTPKAPKLKLTCQTATEAATADTRKVLVWALRRILVNGDGSCCIFLREVDPQRSRSLRQTERNLELL